MLEGTGLFQNYGASEKQNVDLFIRNGSLLGTKVNFVILYILSMNYNLRHLELNKKNHSFALYVLIN